MLPLLIKPRYLTLKNSWTSGALFKGQRGRNLTILGISLLLMLAMYRGAFDILSKLAAAKAPLNIPPTLTLALLISLLLTMLIFSNAVSALGTLFLSHDLELILASPIKKWRFFISKLGDVMISSSWMGLVFGIPTLVAYGQAYQATIWFYLLSLIVAIPLLLIPSGLALGGVTLFARIVPASRTREIMLLCCALSLLGVYLVFKIVFGEEETIHEPSQVEKVHMMLRYAGSAWNPSSWAASALGGFLSHNRGVVAPIAVLYTIASVILICAFTLVHYFHYTAYSKAKSTGSLKLKSRLSQRIFILLTPFLGSHYRAFLVKEYKVFCRDLAQAIQLLVLIGICMIYLYNFKVLHAVEGLPEQVKNWWQAFLVLSNFSMGAFVLTAVSTRFVFPSVSLEGNAYWIIQCSPVDSYELLKAKFWAWFMPLCIVGCTIFGSGALAIDAEPHIVTLNMLASCFLCYGLVGLAIGLGAFFANFRWEHSSQLSASVGSLIFMLASAILIVLNLIPTCTLLALRTLRNSGVEFSTLEWYLGVTCSATVLVYVNYAAARWALSLGDNSLKSLR